MSIAEPTPQFFAENQEKLATEIGTNPKTVYHRKYRERNRERLRKQRMERYHNNPDQDRQWRRNGINRLREEVLTHYGGKCVYCGNTNLDVLMLAYWPESPQDSPTDPHIANSGGSAKRYRMIRQAGFPKGYEVRCHNCDSTRRRHEIAPVHEGEETEGEAEVRKAYERSVAEAIDQEIFDDPDVENPAAEDDAA